MKAKYSNRNLIKFMKIKFKSGFSKFDKLKLCLIYNGLVYPHPIIKCISNKLFNINAPPTIYVYYGMLEHVVNQHIYWSLNCSMLHFIR